MGSGSVSTAVANWLKTQAASDDEVLSSQAVWSLAVNRSLDPEIWSSLNRRNSQDLWIGVSRDLLITA